jgi:pimeloyl-ACP methyl ester carboxylesterase
MNPLRLRSSSISACYQLAFSFRRIIYYLLTCLCLVPVFTQAQITTYNSGQAFTCITVDAFGRIWAGTNKAGIYVLDVNEKRKATAFTKKSFGSLDNYGIQTLAAGKYTSLWVGHNGLGSSASAGGGIDEISTKTMSYVKHYSSDRNAECFSFLARDGLASSNSICLSVDNAGTVWSAQRYHDLTSGGQYILTPGSLSFKPLSSKNFLSKGTYEDYRKNNDPLELPYPAYTCNPPVTQTPQARNCYAVAAGKDAVWLSVGPYVAKNGSVFPARLLKYDLKGFYTNTSFNLVSSGIGGGGIFWSICVTPKGNVWVTTSLGKIAFYNGVRWQVVTLPSTFPSSISPNQNAIASDDQGRIYIGTNKGLIVYNGGSLLQDNSFKLYSGAEGLSSTNIRGIAVEKDGAVWMATDNGIAKINSYPFTVYNLIHPEPGKETEADNFSILSLNDAGAQDNGDPVEINVAADSSSSTMIVYTGNEPLTKVLRIMKHGEQVANDPTNTSDYGWLQEKLRNEDSLVYLYHHPSYVVDGEIEKYQRIDFVLEDTRNNVVFTEGKLNIHHAPVLMVHGVWSDINAFGAMEQYLLTQSYNYEPYQLKRIWYANVKHSEPVNSQVYYRFEIPHGIDALLAECRANRLSAGKVNIVAHSRGGLFARYYLQSSSPDVPYLNDVNTLITINSPHSGSQAANLILDKRQVLPALTVGQLLRPLVLEIWDDPNGAYELKVNSPAIVNDLNNPKALERNKVPSHAITTQYIFGANSNSDFLLKKYIKEGMRIPSIGTFILGLRIYALLLGTSCLEGPIDNCLLGIYKDAHDVVVPLKSQQGGLESGAISLLGNGKLAHSIKKFEPLDIDLPGVTYAEETHREVTNLLRKNPDDKYGSFTKNGFHPENLSSTYTFLPNLPGTPETGRIAGTEVVIDSSLKGKFFKYGDTVQVTVTGSAAIKTLLVAYTSNSLPEAASDVEPASSFTFPFPIPKEAFGQVKITAYGFNDNGLVAVDTTFINVGVPSGVILDSVRIQKNENNQLRVAANDNIQLTVLGYFSDTVRRIDVSPDIVYSFRSSGIAATSYPNLLIGILPGKSDQLMVEYMSKRDTATVLVTDSIPAAAPVSNLPVTLQSFTAEYKNKEVLLEWTTAQEQNNKEFEVQYSDGGSLFETIGSVPGKGNTNEISHYVYPTKQYKAGKNYYRLKQIDLDGHFKYSPVVLLNINEEQLFSVSLYPNPARNKVIVGLSQPVTGSLHLQIADIQGRRVWARSLAGTSLALPVDLPSLAGGVYLITITNAKGELLLNSKLVVQ